MCIFQRLSTSPSITGGFLEFVEFSVAETRAEIVGFKIHRMARGRTVVKDYNQIIHEDVQDVIQQSQITHRSSTIPTSPRGGVFLSYNQPIYLIALSSNLNFILNYTTNRLLKWTTHITSFIFILFKTRTRAAEKGPR